ncbi:YiiX/YebB-like N1pC/P60 family cysteine hydrolase [Rhodocyclus purpureus]|uniref:YiiX/YebB-like N1pC/P60 family cysteine hydrolase n=1 Tax=Rhodocyclus purpureus TaxID=1067 RepID=UPI001913D99F|nr:YiiX/YebB-like N1pC/P60 family cysteine hydrolase [Rhodocyclus purpureus]MBK5914573.1 hypothetical protein [Rhodocyclus purpureus]
MASIRLLFSTSHHPISAAIRACTWSKWSHVALLDGPFAIEAVATGVRKVPALEAMDRAKRAVAVELQCRDPRAVIAAAESQIGKPYDFAAIVGFGLRRDWQEDDRWFCSELVAWAFQRAGQPLFRAECMHRITPEHLWMLAPAPTPPDRAVFVTP